MGSSRASLRGRSPSPQESPSPPPRSPSPPPRSSTPPKCSPSPPLKSPSPPPKSPSPHRSPSRSTARHSSPPRSPRKSPSRSPSRHSFGRSSHHSSGTAFQHVSRSPSRRSHSSERRSPSCHESERGRSPSRHSSHRSPRRSSQPSHDRIEQQQQNVEATGWSPTFSRRSVRTTPRSPSPNISPRSSRSSLRSQASHHSQTFHHSQSQSQHNDQRNDIRTGNVTQITYITQPSISAAAYISDSARREARSRSRSRHRRWQLDRSRDIARERQLSHFVYHNPHNPASYGLSVYAGNRNRGRREYGFGPGVLRDFGTPHDEKRWNDVDRLLEPGTRERRGRNLWRSSRRYAGVDEYVYGNSSTRRSRRGGGVASGLATISSGFIGLGAEAEGGYAGAQATNNRYTGTLGSYRRPRPPRANRDRSSVQPLVELVTNRPDNPNRTYIERSPSGELTRPCQRRNTIKGSPSREEFFTAYDYPRRPSRTREKDWPHFPPTRLMNPPPYAAASQAAGSSVGKGSVSDSVSGSVSGVNGSVSGSVSDGKSPPSDGVGREKDAVVNPTSLPAPAVTTSKAGISRKASVKKSFSRKESSKTTSRPERSANASTDYPPRGQPVREDYLGGSNTTYHDQSYPPASGVGAVARATPSAAYMGPAQTAGTVAMVRTNGEGEGLRLEKTGTRMARLRARLCGGINVPAA